MIVFSKLGEKGNLGNQLFQIASTIGIAKMNNQDYYFPPWCYQPYFKHQLPCKVINENDYKTIREICFSYSFINLKEEEDYNLIGWFQSEKYFDVKSVGKYFTFKNSLTKQIKNKYSYLLEAKHILISVRRGDFVNHPYYFQLSYKYYFLAIVKNFPDWKSRKLIFTSDDIAYCKRHFSFLDNSYFLEDLNAIEQLAFGSMSKDIVISNSTFSWWLAWLGEKKKSLIIRPEKNFRGDFAGRNDDKDYFPERWIQFKVPKNLINLKYFRLIAVGESYRIVNYLIYLIKTWKKILKETLKRLIKNYYSM